MADTFKIFGSNVPKNAAYIGGGLIVVGGVYYYRKQKAAQAAQKSVQDASTNAIDPATGYPYGSAEDAAQLATQGQYVNPADYALSGGYGYSGYAGGSGTGSFGAGNPGSFLNNSEWAQYVESYEVNTLGADAPTVGNAIGKYLTGQPLDQNMVAIVQSAIAIGGYPPVSGPNGNPPSFTTSGGTSPTPTPTPTPIPNPQPTPNPVPSPNPSPNPSARMAGAIGGLSGTATRNSISVHWSPAVNATGYSWVVRDLATHTQVKSGRTNATSVTVGGLQSGIDYNFGIQGLPGGPGDNIHIRTL